MTQDIATATALIDAEIGENIGVRTVKRRIDGTGGDRLILPHTPTSVTSLKDNKTGESLTILEIADNALYLDGASYRGRGNLTIEYITGFVSVPTEIERVCLDLIKEITANRKSAAAGSGAVKKKTIGDTSFEYAVQSGASVGFTALANAATILRVYRPFAFSVCS